MLGNANFVVKKSSNAFSFLLVLQVLADSGPCTDTAFTKALTNSDTETDTSVQRKQFTVMVNKVWS